MIDGSSFELCQEEKPGAAFTNAQYKFSWMFHPIIFLYNTVLSLEKQIIGNDILLSKIGLRTFVKTTTLTNFWKY